jgi:hypothetical protein
MRCARVLRIAAVLAAIPLAAQVAGAQTPRVEQSANFNHVIYASAFCGATYDNVCLSAALEAIGPSGQALIITRPFTLNANVTIPSNVTLVFDGGSLNPASAHKLTVNGPVKAAPTAQIFGGAGTVSISNGAPIQAGWFAGAGATAKIAVGLASCSSLTSCTVLAGPGLGSGAGPSVPEKALFLDTRGDSAGHSQWWLTSGQVRETPTSDDILLGVDNTRSNPTAAPTTLFLNQTVTGDLGSLGTGGATWTQFNFINAHNLSNVPDYALLTAFWSEAWGTGSLTGSPHVRLAAGGGQGVIENNGPSDSAVYDQIYTRMFLSPYMAERCAARAGTITVTYGSATVTGSGTDFAAADAGNELFAGTGFGGLDNAQTFGTVQTVNSAARLTLASAWTGATRTGVEWTTQPSPATGACGGTANARRTPTVYLEQGPIGTSDQAAAYVNGLLPETPAWFKWLEGGNPLWSLGTENNPAELAGNVQNDFALGNAHLSGMGFRYQNQTNGNVYIGATGTGSVIINGAPTFTGEGASAQATGGLKVYAGGSSGAMPATPNGLVEAGALVPQMTQVPFSAIPTFDARHSNSFKITLRGNVIRSTLSNAKAGQPLYLLICQDRIGSHTFVWPSNVLGGMRIASPASKCSAQTFIFDGRNAYALSSGVTNM